MPQSLPPGLSYDGAPRHIFVLVRVEGGKSFYVKSALWPILRPLGSSKHRPTGEFDFTSDISQARVFTWDEASNWASLAQIGGEGDYVAWFAIGHRYSIEE
jgi:hypothetical protein